MKKFLKIVLAVIAAVILIGVSAIFIIYFARGNMKDEQLPSGFEESIEADALENEADVRIMSSNLLVHYKSWGGTPASPRAAKYLKIIENYAPDVVGLQELSDEWLSCLNNNLPEQYKMLFPFSTAAGFKLTAMIYNTDTLELVDSGSFSYEECENKRLRRVVWGVFKDIESGKTFAATSTHLSLLFGGREEEFKDVMRSQANELIEFSSYLNENYNCPVISVGDYNTREDVEEGKRNDDFPEIYNTLSTALTDVKYIAEKQICGNGEDYNEPSWDHIFLKGDAQVKAFNLLSADYLMDMSDHCSIYADFAL